MGVNKEVMDWIRDHGEERHFDNAFGDQVLCYGGNIKVFEPPSVKHLGLSTISGMAGFVASQVPSMKGDLGVLLCSYDSITWCESDGLRDRARYAVATCLNPNLPGKYTLDHAVSVLSLRCEESEDRELLRRVFSDVQVQDTAVQQTKGLGWKISAEKGLSGGSWHEVETPYFRLRPYSVFPEAVEHQPERTFYVTVRLTGEGRDSVRVTIDEVEDVAWRAAAASEVAGRLKSELNLALGDRDVPAVIC